MLTREATTEQLRNALENEGVVLQDDASRRTLLDVAKDLGLVEDASKAVLDENASNEEIIEKLAEKNVKVLPSISRKLLLRLARQNGLMGSGASKVPASKRAEYGKDQNCGDEVAEALKDACPKGGVEDAVVEIGDQNGIDVLKRWGNLNPGMKRMSLGNVLRSRVKHGQKVVIGEQVWNEDGEIAEAG